MGNLKWAWTGQKPTEPFIIGGVYEVIYGPYKYHKGVLMGTGESDCEWVLKIKDNMYVYPFEDEVILIKGRDE